MTMQTKVLEPSPETTAYVVSTLRSGQPVAIPTETVYGLAADAFNQDAVLKVFQVKERPSFDPLIVHVDPSLNSLAALEAAHLVDGRNLTAGCRKLVDDLIRQFWPGPLTLILPKTAKVPDLVTAGLPGIGIRMPSHPVAQEIIHAFGGPLAAPSANRFGRISPTSASDVAAELGGLIDCIVDGGPCNRGIESTVVGIENDGRMTLLRSGAIPREAIEQVTGETMQTISHARELAAPGMTESHYAPGSRVVILNRPIDTTWTSLDIPPEARGVQAALLCVSGDSAAKARILEPLGVGILAHRTLSPAGDDAEAAQNLFTSLRRLDIPDSSLILVEPCSTTAGLWHAIQDRLTRAAAPRHADPKT